MIDVTLLTKRYGPTVAVDSLTFGARPGHVTGFLGPNGSGKSTTLRLVLGLDRPTSGTALVDGRPYRELTDPVRHVGAMLDARHVHPGRTARHHLLALARAGRLPRSRVDEVLDAVGLADVADRRAGGYSLGMQQRLGIAAALLGDPGTLLLDEPVNGLDADGVRWVRDLVRRLAVEGRTVVLSSHLLGEMEQVADRVVVIGRGRLIADTTVAELVAAHGASATRVRCTEPELLRPALDRAGAQVTGQPDGCWLVHGPDAAAIGRIARTHGITLVELSPVRSSLEDVYTRLTRASVEYAGARQGTES